MDSPTAAEVTVIGGGLAGLVAANAVAERGLPVRLYEAHGTLGGRGRAAPPPYVAHEGAHVFYAGMPYWPWLTARGLVPPLCRPPLAESRPGFVRDGRLRLAPPPGLVRMMLPDRPRTAPVDQDFRTWATRRYGVAAARHAARALGVVTYDADTGRLSAAFCWELFRRIFTFRRPAVRWVRGGWQAVIGRLEARARRLGVRIELNARLTAPPGGGPVIVATELASARALLGDATLRGTSGHAALLDLAVRRAPGDRFLAFDLDAGGFHESYSAQDPTVAPPGESLYQLTMPVRADETPARARERLEALAGLTVPGWRERVTWRRAGTAKGRTGALDLPGRTWRDRPAVDRGDGVLLAGDMVAAPGMRGEIAAHSALCAADLAVAASRPGRC
ncbi:NAD(P)-binding protein [Streptomyces albiaxialis]|uniref:NAD(P)-binding protein n=1 Tax=Streptomyces albiaxialis TaxID=329523 RepID=A0ABN2VNQ6_9ACTN